MRAGSGFWLAVLILTFQFLTMPPGVFATDASQDAIAKAAALSKAGNRKQAEAVLRAASAADPNSADLHGALGELLLKTHRYEDSVQELGVATQQEPDSAAFNLLLSEALIGWKHYGVALDFLNAVRPKFGREPQFHYDLGLVYYNLDKMNESQSEFKEALRLAPKFEKAQFMFAVTLASTGKPAEAGETLRRLVKEHPDNIVYWLTLGQILGPLGGSSSADAVKAVRRALAMAPSDAHVQFVAATVFSETGDFAAARPLLEHLEKVDPKILPVHVQLARVYSRLGQREQARKETELASQLEKQNASAGQDPAGQAPATQPPDGGSEQH